MKGRDSNGARVTRVDTDVGAGRTRQMCSREDAATRLHISPSTVDKLRRKGILRSMRCGRKVLIDVSSIDAYAGPVEAAIGDDDVVARHASQFRTRDETATRLHMSASTVDQLCHEGILRSIRCGRKVLIDVASVDAYASPVEAAIEAALNGRDSAAIEAPLTEHKSIASIGARESISSKLLSLRPATKLSRQEAVQLALALLSFLIGEPEQPMTDGQRSRQLR
jgi:excisionase family DNA binding protein